MGNQFEPLKCHSNGSPSSYHALGVGLDIKQTAVQWNGNASREPVAVNFTASDRPSPKFTP